MLFVGLLGGPFIWLGVRPYAVAISRTSSCCGQLSSPGRSSHCSSCGTAPALPRPAGWLAACQVLQTLCSIYYGVYLVIALVVVATVLALRDRDRMRQREPCLGAAALVTALTLAPYAAIYARAGGLLPARSLAEMATYSADALRLSARFARSPTAAATRRRGVRGTGDVSRCDWCTKDSSSRRVARSS